jgi:hypothetical protein
MPAHQDGQLHACRYERWCVLCKWPRVLTILQHATTVLQALHLLSDHPAATRVVGCTQHTVSAPTAAQWTACLDCLCHALNSQQLQRYSPTVNWQASAAAAGDFTSRARPTPPITTSNRVLRGLLGKHLSRRPTTCMRLLCALSSPHSADHFHGRFQRTGQSVRRSGLSRESGSAVSTCVLNIYRLLHSCVGIDDVQ